MRYLACVISRFTRVDDARPADRRRGRSGRRRTPVTADRRQANPRQVARARALADRAAAILEFYGRLIGDAPYPSFTLAVTESDLPGGHSPAVFRDAQSAAAAVAARLAQRSGRFDNYPSFFLAHEIAHQWWGQAVGWKNYHEQWISEGLRAVLRRALRGARTAATRCSAACCGRCAAGRSSSRRRARSISATGSATSRAKDASSARSSTTRAAMVLHMLRRLVGDETFFAGLRQFYATWKFRKAGTDDFRLAMEKAERHGSRRRSSRLDLRRRDPGARVHVDGQRRARRGAVRAPRRRHADAGDGHDHVCRRDERGRGRRGDRARWSSGRSR